MRRLAAALLLVALLVPVAGAQAQNNPFGPLPQAPAAPTATPTPANSSTQDDVSRSTLLLIALGVAVVFVGLGVAITRDARRNLTEEDRLALERGPAQGRQRTAAKSKARQKGKAQRAARRKTRR